MQGINNGKPDIRAMFFDIDGTLLSIKKHSVPQSAMDALAMAKKRGILLFAATGRHMHSLRQFPQLSKVGFDGYVLMNGSYCVRGSTVVSRSPIDNRDVRVMVEHCLHYDVPCKFLEADNLYINRIDDVVRRVHSEIDGELPAVRDVRRALDADIFQMELYTPGNETPPVLRQLERCAYTKWFSNGLDIVPLGVNKLAGVKKMLEHYGLHPRQAAAFGDNENDVEMLSGVGFSVAMGNALDCVKSSARYITDDVDNDGIRNMIQYFLE